MYEFVDNFRGHLEPTFGKGLYKGLDTVGSHHHLFNCPWVYDIISQSVQKVQPPRAEHLVHEDEVFSGNSLRFWGSYPSLVNMCPSISYAYVGGMRHFDAQFPSMDAILKEAGL